MTRRIASEERPKSWKEALHVSLHRSDRPLKEIADLCGVSRQYLQSAADEDQPHANLSARHLPALARLCSQPAFLDYLEHQAGRVAFRLPSHSDARGLGAALEEIGQWVQAHGAALEDGIVTADEFEAAEKEAHEAIAAVVAAVEQLRVRVLPSDSPVAPAPTVVRIGVAR